ncbi:hypothetical protein Tco_1216825 [Tanacetum coccineum]
MEAFIRGLTQSIEGNVTASKPQTLKEATNIAHGLMDQIIKRNSMQETNDHKQKFDDKRNTTNNNNYPNNSNNNNYSNNPAIMITISSKIEARKPSRLMETVDIMDLIPFVGNPSTYTSVHSEARLWSIPSEDPYEEAAQQLFEQAPHSPEYVPEDHVPVYILEPEHPEDLVPAKDEAPYNLPPPFFLSPRIRPPHTRAAMRQMRATVPSTYHSLLPSGTPPLLPIPLPTPSISRRADISKADTPPRKRLLLTTPRPSGEVGESSTAAAARRPGPTIETRLRDTERRMMTALAVRAEIEVLRRERLAYEAFEATSLDAGARVDSLEDTSIMFSCDLRKWHQGRPTRLNPDATPTPVTDTHTTTSVTSAQLQAMIDEGVTAVLAARATTRNGDDSHTSGTGVRRNERAVRECTYQDFMKCQPLFFRGTEGVVDLTQWFERMETVFGIVTARGESSESLPLVLFMGIALTWWNYM